MALTSEERWEQAHSCRGWLPYAHLYRKDALVDCVCGKLYIRRNTLEGVPTWKVVRWWHRIGL